MHTSKPTRSVDGQDKKILVIEYDVTGLTAKQVDRLMMEAVVQGEASDDDEGDGHPDVPVITTKVVTRGKGGR
jgi:hypothetical protein